MSSRRILESVLAVPLALFALSGMFQQFGIEADLEGIQEFVEDTTTQTLQGGSNLGGTPGGLLAVPMAFVNVWLRPFPWDVHNMTAAIAAGEMLLFYYLFWGRRSFLKGSLKRWRQEKILRFALPFVVIYSLMIGLAFANLGLIARQRTPIFPFGLMLLFVPTLASLRTEVEPEEQETVEMPQKQTLSESEPIANQPEEKTGIAAWPDWAWEPLEHSPEGSLRKEPDHK